MNYSLIRAVLGGTWSVDLTTFLQYEQIKDAILNGASFEFEEDKIPALHFMHPQSGEDVSMIAENSSMDGWIAVHNITGIMLKYDTSCGPKGMKSFADNFLRADANPRVDAHVIVFDSGGGASDSVPVLRNAFMKAKKPIVAFNDSMMASAAYYAAIYANEIIAAPESRVGSIGTFISFSGFPKDTTHEGKRYVRVYADTSEEKNAEFEQALEGNYTLVKEQILNPHDADFMNDVKSKRQNVSEKQLKGGVTYSRDAVGSLVDRVGSFDDAISRAAELANESKKKNSKSKNKMSDKTYPRLVAVIGVELAVMEDGIHLDHTLAELIEAKIAELEAIVSAYSGLQEGETIQSLKESISDLTKDRDTLKTEKADQDEKIISLTAEVEKLSKTPPAGKTGAHQKGSEEGAESVDDEAQYFAKLSKIK